MVDKYDATLEVLFSGEMIKYALVFNKKNAPIMVPVVKFIKNIEHRSDLVYIPEATSVLENV